MWRGLGEGVSQRGTGSEVNFPSAGTGAQGSVSPRTSNGTFPKLTENALQQFDKLAVQQVTPDCVQSSGRPNVMPIPKTLGNKPVWDVEAGNGSPKKATNAKPSSHEASSLLTVLVAYGMMILWVAYLVFNVLLL